MPVLLELFLTFFKIGLFAVGGGLATLPFLYDLADTTNWITVADISNMIAISESTPGPIGINMATYVGFLREGFLGAVITPLGEVAPSVIIIIIVAKFLQKFRESVIFKDVFYGLRPASAAMIAAAGFGIVKISFFGDSYSEFFWQGAILAVLLYIALKKFKLHPVVYIGISAVVGVIFKFSM